MTTTDRTADSTTALLAALRAGGYTVSTVVTGAVIVDGQHIDACRWDDMAMAWDGTADGLEELGWGRAADAMRDERAPMTTTNKTFRIVSSAGVDMGTYTAETPAEALDAMAQDAGYADDDEASEVAGPFDGTVEVVEEE